MKYAVQLCFGFGDVRTRGSVARWRHAARKWRASGATVHFVAGAAQPKSGQRVVSVRLRFSRRVVTIVDLPLRVPGRAGGIPSTCISTGILAGTVYREYSPNLVIYVAVIDEESRECDCHISRLARGGSGSTECMRERERESEKDAASE